MDYVQMMLLMFIVPMVIQLVFDLLVKVRVLLV